MRKIYHICLSSHDEILFRDPADYIFGFNCLAETVLLTESRLLAEGFMSTHWHCVVQTDDPKYFAHRFRYAYCRQFNVRHKRQGRLAEKQAFITEIEGVHRLMTALNYVNRQGLHHGLAGTPFDYPHCSANSFFRKELGKPAPVKAMLLPTGLRHRYLSRNITIPERYRMNSEGQLLREDIIDTSYVEQVYITPRNFLFQMNKSTDEKDVAEQRQEKSGTPVITIDLIEQGTPDFDPRQMLVNEQGRVNKGRMTDMEMCRLIDEYYVPRMKGETSEATLYTCTDRERNSLYETIAQDVQRARYANKNDQRTLIGRAGLSGKYVGESQLRRCLAI